MDDFYKLLAQTAKKVSVAIKADGQKDVCVEYSAFGKEHKDNLDEIAANGKVILVREPDIWDDDARRSYRSDIMENPTWLQVAVAANRMIKRTRDRHHIFLEGLRQIRTETIDGHEVNVFQFVMGS